MYRIYPYQWEMSFAVTSLWQLSDRDATLSASALLQASVEGSSPVVRQDNKEGSTPHVEPTCHPKDGAFRAPERGIEQMQRDWVPPGYH